MAKGLGVAEAAHLTSLSSLSARPRCMPSASPMTRRQRLRAPAPVGPRAGHLLAIDVPAAASGSAKLLKLVVEGLPVGADAGIADEPFFGASFDHKLMTLITL